MHNDSLIGWNWHNKEAEIHGTVEGELIDNFVEINIFLKTTSISIFALHLVSLY